MQVRVGLAVAGLLASLAVQSGSQAQEVETLAPIEVTAERFTAAAEKPANAASEKIVEGQTILLRPFSRPAEALEVVPGLIITQHSGEGKANQYFLRGYNLDHGTDLAIKIDGMPVNMRTHGHGQGYADFNFLIPELIGNVNIRKGPYYADEGDFASAGSLHVDLVNFVDKPFAQVTVGSFGYRRALGVASTKVGEGNLLVAGELNAHNGPWDTPDRLRKINAVLRYSQGDAANGLSLMGMAYSNRWTSTDQVPERAITSGLISPWGTLDPTDGGKASRFSLSGRYAQTDDKGATKASFYAIRSNLDLFNNFTYFLDDQTNGDQFHQRDIRTVAGFDVAHTFKNVFGSLPVETTFGLQGRYDSIKVALTKTSQRAFLSDVRTDHVKEASLGFYVDNVFKWNDWLRTSVGYRGDVFTTRVSSVFDPLN